MPFAELARRVGIRPNSLYRLMRERDRQPRGIVQCIVGTGGAPLYPLKLVQPNLLANASAFGVLKLTLTSGNYTWVFVPVPGEPFRDSGTAACH